MRYIIGYVFGFTIFLLLIPFGLYELSKLDYLLSGRVMIHSMILRYIISLLIFLFIAVNYLRLSEEKRLLKDFGDEYIDYKKKVPMIFPIKRFKK